MLPIAGADRQEAAGAIPLPSSGHIAASHYSATNRLTRDEARRMAANFVKLPGLLRERG